MDFGFVWRKNLLAVPAVIFFFGSLKAGGFGRAISNRGRYKANILDRICYDYWENEKSVMPPLRNS